MKECLIFDNLYINKYRTGKDSKKVKEKSIVTGSTHGTKFNCVGATKKGIFIKKKVVLGLIVYNFLYAFNLLYVCIFLAFAFLLALYFIA
jgi:hypothetical protein